MKKLISLFLIFHLCGLAALAQGTVSPQQTPQQQTPPPTKKVIVQTPFGPREYDAADVPAGTPTGPAPAAVQGTPAAPPAPPSAVPAQPAPAAPQTPASTGQPDQPLPFTLSLNNQDIYQVIKIIADTLNLNYAIDPSVKGTVNIQTTGTLHRSDLFPILETILKINGATMVNTTGNFWLIVPANSASRQPLQVQDKPPSNNPDDQMVIQIIRMKFVPATEMKNLLTGYLSEGASISVQEAGNILLITERRSNLKKLMELVDIFDANVFADERVRLIPVKNNLARDLISDLNNVFSGYGLTQGSSAIHFAAIDRLNSILVITPNPSVFSDVETWIDRLDQTALRSGTRPYVYPVKNSRASDIQAVLMQIYGGATQLSSIYNQPSGAAQGAAPQSPSAPGPMAAVPTGTAMPAMPGTVTPGSSTLPGVKTNVRIISDTMHNQLIIYADPQTYQEIERLIEQLDILPRQVLIDAQVFEVTLDDSLSLGLSAYLQSKSTLTSSATTASFAATGGGTPALAAQSVAVLGTNALVGFLNASENRSRVRTLSAPSVLVSDNVDADFQVGADVPIPTSSSVTPVTSGGTNLFAQTISYAQTGVILHVKPQINESGNVTLDINQEVSDAEANTTSGVVAPVIGKAAVKSTVVVQDGQTIAIGGFIRENNELDRNRIPLLGKIPYLGNLFGSTSKDVSRTELIVLITPHVLRSHEDADAATEELKAKLKEVQKLLN